MIAGRPENPFTADLEHASASGLARAVRKGLEGRREHERVYAALRQKPEGETGISVASETSGGRRWRSKDVHLRCEGVPDKVRGKLENFAQSFALSLMRAVGNDPSRAALRSRELAGLSREYEGGDFVLSREVAEALGRSKDEDGDRRADWAQRKIGDAIKKYGRGAVIDIFEGLAAVLEEERIR